MDRPRTDRPTSDRPRTARPPSDRPRFDRPREDRPRTGTDRPRPGGPRPTGPRTGSARPGGARPGGPRPGGARTGSARPGGARPGGDRERYERKRDDRRGPRHRDTDASGRRFARPTRFDPATGRAVDETAPTPVGVRPPPRDRAAHLGQAPAATAPRRGPNVRDLALQSLFQVHAKRAFAERVIDDLAEQFRLDVRDRGFLNELVKGTLRRQGALDWQLDRLLHVGFTSLPLWIQDDLRLGAYQLLHLDRIPPRAVVDEAVKLALKYGHPGTAGLSNSVLRRLADEIAGGSVPLPLPTHADGTPNVEALVAITSHPRWLVERWLTRYGLDELLALCEANNRTAALGLRVNRLKLDRKELLKRLATAELTAHEGRWCDVSVVVPADANFANFPSYARGDCTVQDESETMVGFLVAPRPTDRVLDLCAAPGGKTTHLAELMGDQGEVVAVEKMAPRARSMQRQVERLGLRSVLVETADGETANLLALGKGGPYDRALVDAPCSSLGVLARRADARWRKEASGFAELAEHQGLLLRAAAAVVKPGGTLVYSVCSFEPEETDAIVQSFLAGNPEWTKDDAAQFVPADLVETGGAMRILPHRHGTDGAFAVRFTRRAE
jgi:16S rRNA (cytosine967-C5)-methyltransferase